MPITTPAVSCAAALATMLSLTLVGCGRHGDETMPTPATVVMPGSPAPDATSAAASDVSPPPGITASTNATPPVAAASTPSNGLTGGTVTVFSGTAPASSSATSGGTMSTGSTPDTSAIQRTVGIPAPSASLPAPASIGPASAPSTDQPPSVAPGTTR